MKRKGFVRMTAYGLILTMLMSFVGCSGKNQGQSQNLMENMKADDVTAVDILSADNVSVTNFAVRLFQKSCEEGRNTLISPLSVLCALAMTSNGAKDNTLAQMERVLGMSPEEMNQYLHSYLKNLPQKETYKLHLANSIWFTEDENFAVNQDFLQTNADYYGADIYRAPFDDSTLKDINNWVKTKTDDMIPEILDKIPEEAVMYLINALAFEAKWENLYKKNEVDSGIFTLEDGSTQEVEFMHSEENDYLEDNYATGVIKYYEDCKYAFAALLPNEDISVSEYIATLDGEHLNGLLKNRQNITVQTTIPKFETEYDTDMSKVLKGMGMSDAFDEELAELSGLGTAAGRNIYISRVLHKTFISVGEQGTKAGAATVVEAVKECAMQPEETKVVCLDRPFVYMLIDCETCVPFFMGTMMSVK